MMVKGLYNKRLSMYWRKLTLQKLKTGKSLKYTNTNIQWTQKKCLPRLHQNEKITEVQWGKWNAKSEDTQNLGRLNKDTSCKSFA